MQARQAHDKLREFVSTPDARQAEDPEATGAGVLKVEVEVLVIDYCNWPDLSYQNKQHWQNYESFYQWSFYQKLLMKRRSESFVYRDNDIKKKIQ